MAPAAGRQPERTLTTCGTSAAHASKAPPIAECSPSTAARSPRRRSTTPWHAALARRPSRRQVRDEQLVALIADERDANRFAAARVPARCGCGCGCGCGCKGHDVARCPIERLMRERGHPGRHPPAAAVADHDTGSGGGPTGRPGRPALHRDASEPALGRRLHRLPDLVGHGLRRVRLRRLLPPRTQRLLEVCDRIKGAGAADSARSAIRDGGRMATGCPAAGGRRPFGSRHRLGFAGRMRLPTAGVPGRRRPDRWWPRRPPCGPGP